MSVCRKERKRWDFSFIKMHTHRRNILKIYFSYKKEKNACFPMIFFLYVCLSNLYLCRSSVHSYISLMSVIKMFKFVGHLRFTNNRLYGLSPYPAVLFIYLIEIVCLFLHLPTPQFLELLLWVFECQTCINTICTYIVYIYKNA